MKQDKNYYGVDKLKKLLDQKLHLITDQVSKSEGEVAEEKLKEIEQLVALIEIHKAARKGGSKQKWRVFALFSFTLLIISILLFFRVPWTDIELDLEVTEVRFDVSQGQVLTEVLELESIGVQGVQELQLPRLQNVEFESFNKTDGSEDAVRIVRVKDVGSRNSLTLSPVVLPENCRVNLSSSGVNNKFSFSITKTMAQLNAGVFGSIEFTEPGHQSKVARFKTPKTVSIYLDSNEVLVDIELLLNEHAQFSRQLLTKNLSLIKIEQTQHEDRSSVRELSTLLSGTLYFASLGGKERQLRAGEQLRFKATEGEIRTLEIKNGRIHFTFYGTASGMATGNQNVALSLMPTYLDWLSTRHGLSLFWGTTLYVFGMILTLLRWWREPL